MVSGNISSVCMAFGARHVRLNEDRYTLSVTNNVAQRLHNFWRYKVFVDIRWDFVDRGRQTTGGGLKTIANSIPRYLTYNDMLLMTSATNNCTILKFKTRISQAALGRRIFNLGYVFL